MRGENCSSPKLQNQKRKNQSQTDPVLNKLDIRLTKHTKITVIFYKDTCLVW